ncbi:NfeD family protein [Gryllotalpicola reticulitermitis]|uniref:NfeD family protein n=1 Tax=Gryllotalpicola reticulitermitis TaxID=1184153 RepID=A0ABV8QBA9_9MICO
MAGFEWVIWAGLIVVFVAVAMMTAEIEFMLLALGSLGGLVAELLGAPWWLATVIAAIIAVLGTFLLRPRFLNLLRRSSDPTKSNIDAIIGSTGHVLIPVTETSGQVKLGNGETWSARVPEGIQMVLQPGAGVRVLAVDGASVIIEPESSGAQLS